MRILMSSLQQQLQEYQQQTEDALEDYHELQLLLILSNTHEHSTQVTKDLASLLQQYERFLTLLMIESTQCFQEVTKRITTLYQLQQMAAPANDSTKQIVEANILLYLRACYTELRAVDNLFLESRRPATCS